MFISQDATLVQRVPGCTTIVPARQKPNTWPGNYSPQESPPEKSVSVTEFGLLTRLQKASPRSVVFGFILVISTIAQLDTGNPQCDSGRSSRQPCAGRCVVSCAIAAVKGCRPDSASLLTNSHAAERWCQSPSFSQIAQLTRQTSAIRRAESKPFLADRRVHIASASLALTSRNG